jgi:hypothetical protein
MLIDTVTVLSYVIAVLCDADMCDLILLCGANPVLSDAPVLCDARGTYQELSR